jgi:uncharacterized protein (TIGR03435 family)
MLWIMPKTRLGSSILVLAACYGLFGQPDGHPAFQTVSIKQDTSNWNDRLKHPMSMGVNSSLQFLIQFAYAAHDNPMLGHSAPLLASQVVGGPAWIDSFGYDIEVKPSWGSADPKQIWLMWQTLLADRFKLRLHRETRELPTYNLTAARGGLKLAPAKEADCVSFPPGTKPHQIEGKVDCGNIAGPFEDYAGMRMQGSKVHVADLIRQLALVLDRRILDRTGFTGEFDLSLSFTPDGALKGMPPRFRGPSDPKLPNIFAALEEQLGLQLTSATGPVEVLVIDHAEQPAEN